MSGLNGVEFRVTGPGLPAAGETCTTGEGTPAPATGQCAVAVPSGGTYTVTRIGTPSGWYARDSLGVGPVSPLAVAPATYNPVTVSVPANATTVNVPFGAANNPATAGTTTATARTGVFALARDNPQLPPRCGLRFGLLFDLSASITPAFLTDMKNAATKFVEALWGTPSYVSLYTFGTTASPGAAGNSHSPEIATTPDGVNELIARIAGITLPANQYTNWDAGIYQMIVATPRLDEAIVLTDGDPTAYGPSGTFRAGSGIHTRFREVENGVFSANALKSLGTKIFAVGIDENRAGSIQNLTSISGPVSGRDHYETTFDDLADILPEQALENCAGITIRKNASPTTYSEVGQAIHYTYTVTNTGSHFTLDPVTVSDDHIHDPNTVVCEQTRLAPGHSTTCHATYRITQEDLDRGRVTNTATATGRTENGTDVTSDPADATRSSSWRNPRIRITSPRPASGSPTPIG